VRRLAIALVVGLAGIAGCVALANAQRVAPDARPDDRPVMLSEPAPARPAARPRPNRCSAVSVLETVHIDHGTGPEPTWTVRLRCPRKPTDDRLTLRFVGRNVPTCVARGWWPANAHTSDIEVRADRCVWP
jgi:hypothetical protein